jgi:peptidyl-tRNA hydrolase
MFIKREKCWMNIDSEVMIEKISILHQKTFASVGIGIAESEGGLRLSDYVLDFFPEYKDIAYSGSEKICSVLRRNCKILRRNKNK